MAIYVGFLSDMWKDPPRVTVWRAVVGKGRLSEKCGRCVLLFLAYSCNSLGKYVFSGSRELEMLAGRHFDVPRAHPC